MKAISLKHLIQNLSNLGLESLFTKNKSNQQGDIAVLCNTLLQLRGEASSVTLSEEIIAIYSSSTAEEKLEFFSYLKDELQANRDTINEAVSCYQREPSQENILALSKATNSPRRSLFLNLNMAPNGTQALISMRADILGILKQHPELDVVNQDLLQLFKSWFNRGFLEIRRIDWQTPAVVLEKLIEYESVHEIQGWPDLRRRLAEDRRCFGFFHPVMPDEPLIFVEVALCDEISRNITDLLNQESPREVHSDNFKTAIFYSINNCHRGLNGISFGHLLIKQVVEYLVRELPTIKTFATLSPIPRFVSWLKNNLEQLDFVTSELNVSIKQFLDCFDAELLENEELQKALLQLCAYYLIKAKSRNKPADSVARFHLSNGASLEKLNWMADSSENGLQQSAGMMVNYLYDRSTLARNHEAYEQNNEIICSSEIRKSVPSS